LSCSGVPICVEDTAGLVSGLDPSVLIGRHACSAALVVCVLWLVIEMKNIRHVSRELGSLQE
jgi:hypothetical protein